MYNAKKKIWQSLDYSSSQKAWCEAPENRDNPTAMFVRADMCMPQAREGENNAQAVYWMEQSAKGGCANAAFAMGQMFQYGYGVNRNRKNAIHWYEIASNLGYPQAKEALKTLRRQKQWRIFLWLGAVILALSAAVLTVLLFMQEKDPRGVLVHEDTQLLQPEDEESFRQALSKIVAGDSDTQQTNRLLVIYEGESIDLRAFPAVTVLDDGAGYLVIQFADPAQAQDCREALEQMEQVVCVQEDGYFDIQSTGTAVPNATTSSGYTSWGAPYMGLDVLAGWLQTQNTTPVVVAVVDTGTMVAPEYQGRVLDGVDCWGVGNGQLDGDGHGTHVGSIVLDCTRGLDVTVLPIRVFDENARTTDAIYLEGIKEAIRSNADVINLSSGGQCNYSVPGDSCGDMVDYYLGRAVAQGQVVVVSAGNDSSDSAGYCPAHLEECIVVSACDITGQYTSFTNYGASVDVCAPGEDIVNYYQNLQLCYVSGTSQAAPHISALAAMLRLYLPNKTVAQIEKYIKDYCYLNGDPLYFGAGIPWAGYFAGD